MIDDDIVLRTVLGGTGATAALVEGRVVPRGAALSFVEVPRLIDGFRRMVRATEFDLCEMAITTYLSAREHGKPLIALPVFPVQAFHHGAILVRAEGDIRSPHDLEGRKVGVNRGYTVTTGVWARGVLAEEYGVDLSRITWILSGDEHVAEFRPPANVVPVAPGTTIPDQLLAGDLAAAIGIPAEGAVRPLIADPEDAGFARMLRDGHYPINHLVVMRAELAAAHPGLARRLFEAFVAAKGAYLADLAARAPANAGERLHARIMALPADPLPYGVQPNRAMLDTLMGHAVAQGILSAPIPVEDLFAPEAIGLAG